MFLSPKLRHLCLSRSTGTSIVSTNRPECRIRLSITSVLHLLLCSFGDVFTYTILEGVYGDQFIGGLSNDCSGWIGELKLLVLAWRWRSLASHRSGAWRCVYQQFTEINQEWPSGLQVQFQNEFPGYRELRSSKTHIKVVIGGIHSVQPFFYSPRKYLTSPSQIWMVWGGSCLVLSHPINRETSIRCVVAANGTDESTGVLI